MHTFVLIFKNPHSKNARDYCVTYICTFVSVHSTFIYHILQPCAEHAVLIPTLKIKPVKYIKGHRGKYQRIRKVLQYMQCLCHWHRSIRPLGELPTLYPHRISKDLWWPRWNISQDSTPHCVSYVICFNCDWLELGFISVAIWLSTYETLWVHRHGWLFTWKGPKGVGSYPEILTNRKRRKQSFLYDNKKNNEVVD